MDDSVIATDWLLLAAAAPFIAAALASALQKSLGRPASIVLALFPAAIFIFLVNLIGPVSEGVRYVGGVDWLPAYGVRLSFMVDGLSLLFGLLISGIGTLIILYAGGYMKGHPQAGRFLTYMLLFMGAMLGLVLADDVITLFVFWEGTSITSFLLIGFDHTRRASRRAALQALVITGAGGLCLLAAVLLAGQITGEGSLSGIIASGDALRSSGMYLTVLLLFLGAAFTKSAQFPLHVWLPNAMEAPTPVSAYLHSATMVKAGVYLLMRMHPSLGGTVEWTTILPLFGGATLLVGGILALRQTDLKLMLAYTTVASLGLLVMLVGVGTDAAILGAVAYLFAHSLFKGALFMVAGAIDHEAGTRDIRRLGGLRSAMPVTFAAAIVAAISMAGLPPMFGFVAKEGLYLGLTEPMMPVLAAVALIGNAMMFAIAVSVGLKPFIGPHVDTPKHAHEGPFELWAGPVALGFVGLMAALATYATTNALLLPMAAAILGFRGEATLHLVPYAINAPLILSAITVAIGVVIYLRLTAVRSIIDRSLVTIGWGPDRGFDQVVAGIVTASAAFTRIIQHGHLERYVWVTMAAAATALLAPMILFDELPAVPDFPSLRFHEWAVFVIAAVGLLAVVFARTRLTAIVSLGIQGFAAAVIFLLFGAPDLSFTQFMVETLSVVILALVLTRLSLGERDHRPRRQQIVDGGLAVAVGSGFTMVLLSVVQTPFDRTLTDFFETYSLNIAHGRNIVNVIIVDFRGMDTLGEIAVVMITGLAILALLKVKSRQRILPDHKPAEKRL